MLQSGKLDDNKSVRKKHLPVNKGKRAARFLREMRWIRALAKFPQSIIRYGEKQKWKNFYGGRLCKNVL